MPASPVLISAWARSAVVPCGGAFRALHAHDLAAPVVRALLQRAGLSEHAVDAMVVGNALGAGGNPARMMALAAGLSERCQSLSIDTQCCSGLDAVAMGANLIATGQANVVVAGGVEAWSRAPIRQHRPLREGELATTYERPAFAPRAEQDPDLLVAAARYAQAHHITRVQQDAYAVSSHQRAVLHQSDLSDEVVSIEGVTHDAYPRHLDASRVARMPVAAISDQHPDPTCAVSTLAISSKADGAAFVLLVNPACVQTLGITVRARWRQHAAIGSSPSMPLLAAEAATREVLQRANLHLDQLHTVELHDAFAAQGIGFLTNLNLAPERLNPRGGGLARGHPIGASGAIALVRLLSDLQRNGAAQRLGLVAIAGAGGVGSAAAVEGV